MERLLDKYNLEILSIQNFNNILIDKIKKFKRQRNTLQTVAKEFKKNVGVYYHVYNCCNDREVQKQNINSLIEKINNIIKKEEEQLKENILNRQKLLNQRNKLEDDLFIAQYQF